MTNDGHRHFYAALLAVTILSLLALALSGCAPEPAPVVVSAPAPVVTQKLGAIIPEKTLLCLAEPNGNTAKTIRQSAKYIIDLKAAGQDCRQKLGIVRDLIQNEK